MPWLVLPRSRKSIASIFSVCWSKRATAVYPWGSWAKRTGLPGATLNNHLHMLRRAGLVSDERRGRVIQCTANYTQMNDLLGYLSENCCAGSSSSAACQPAAVCKPRRRNIMKRFHVHVNVDELDSSIHFYFHTVWHRTQRHQNPITPNGC